MGELEDRLRAARYYARLDQEPWANELETSVGTVTRIENGTKTVDPDKERYLLERAAAVTGWPVAFFTADLGILDRPSAQRATGDGDVSRQLKRLSKELADLRKAHEREVDRISRKVASDRGRLTSMERNLKILAEAAVQDRGGL